jgi:predicted transglutaminase-like cysteine proteinase
MRMFNPAVFFSHSDTTSHHGSDDMTTCERRVGRNWSLLLIFGSMTTAVVALLFWLASALLSMVSAAEPIAFSIYCMDHIEECPTKGPGFVRYSPTLMQLVSRVQTQVNGAIKPRRETVDTWSADVSSGDCDDYVMTKRRRLIRAGVPATAMRIVVSRRSGEGHVVLVLKTDRGEIVLDNLRRTAYLR